MERTSRRMFMKQAGTAAAVAGAVAAAPIGVANAVGSTMRTSGAPSVDATLPGGLDVSGGGDLIAHLKDASTGEISLFVGTREVVIHDRDVAAWLHRAAR